MSEAFTAAIQAMENRDLDELGRIIEANPSVVHEHDEEKRTLLLFASTTGEVRFLQPLIEAGCKIDGPGDTALQWAASESHIDVCKYLIEQGASLFVDGNLADGGTPLVQALFYGHSEMADYLASLEITPRNLRVAAGLGRVDIIEEFFDSSGLLTESAGRYRKWYRANDEFFEKPTTDTTQEILDEALCYACFNNRIEAVKILLERGANPAGKPHFATALHFSVAKCNKELIDVLIEKGADPFIRDDIYTSTPIGWAEWAGDSSVIDHLIEHMKEKDLRVAVMTGCYDTVERVLSNTPVDEVCGENGRQSLVQAIESKNEQIEKLLREHGIGLSLPLAALLDREVEVKELLERGALPDETLEIKIPMPGLGTANREISALLLSAIHKRKKICDFLIEAGAKIDLHCAAALNMVSIVRKLLDEGYPVDQEDQIGRTPLHRAIQGDAHEVVRLLLEKGADMKKTSDFFSFGPTAIHVAAESGASREMLELLIENGADLNSALNQGTPLDCAYRAGKEEAVENLRDLGATDCDYFDKENSD
ncbi:MAG: ankyrin repeat domain-containing protein [Candidatus Obscuribacterales bacterium]|nr:ankyrin repeat domain-containing protein [Candidatus Obscuribacterales bacterium]